MDATAFMNAVATRIPSLKKSAAQRARAPTIVRSAETDPRQGEARARSPQRRFGFLPFALLPAFVVFRVAFLAGFFFEADFLALFFPATP